jgi:DNA polymerase V
MSRPAALSRDRIGGGRAYALIDGNSFYCSCKRVFDPKLTKVPVIVLPRRATG